MAEPKGTVKLKQNSGPYHYPVWLPEPNRQAQEDTVYMSTQKIRPMNVYVAPKSAAETSIRKSIVMPELAPGLPATPEHDLVFNGGKTIANLNFRNYYVGGAGAWQASDMTSIDAALSAAMSDPNLNNVMVQYFPGGAITSNFLGSQVLPGAPPAVFSQGDTEALVQSLSDSGALDGLDLSSTLINIMLPSGTILNTDAAPAGGAMKMAAVAIPKDDEDSTKGLGGYHGSIHPARADGQPTVYYAVGVFSEVRPDGSNNGIPVFDQPWKNVVATFYHELNEARTDADVEDAIRAGNDPNAGKFLGWVSQQGEECGDFPVFEANPLTEVFQEVPLADGSGTVPVQFQYSDAVHGPEGPIPAPDPPVAVAVGA